jgi:hypothetical protein
MIFVAPRWLIVTEEGEQAALLQLSARCLYQERAPSARSDQTIDLLEEILRQDDMRPLCAHIYPTSIVT